METVGEYEYSTKDLIGHGAFAVVYKGRVKKKTDSRVAIKCITKKNLSKSQSLLEKEICILKELTKLQHENVVALMDCKDTSYHVYLVMEYCNGGDLADYLHGKGTLSEDTIRLFVRQLAGAMKALYIKGIVHRDLKPQNILLSHEGKSNPSPEEIKLKIADFGFARFLQDGVMAATLCGSPMYMAPEVIMSLQYDAKADLWSLGTIVFQCLVGKAPFQANTPQALKMLYEKNANLAPKIPDGTSSELRDLLMRLLKRNAKDRLEFEEFFVHPFLQILHKTSSPVPVPSPGRKNSDCPSPYPGMTPVGSGACSPKQFGISQSPPAGAVPRSPNMTDISSSVKTKYSRDLQTSQSGNDYHMTDDNDDFVIVPTNIPFDSDANPCQKRSHPSYSSGSSGPSGRSSAGIGGSNIMEVGSQISVPPESPSSRPSFLPVTTTSGNTVLESHPIPVPSQKAAFQQIQQTLGLDVCHDNTTNLNANTKDNDPRDMRRNKKRNSGNGNTDMECLSEKDSTTSSPITMRRQSSLCGPDISSLSPPSIQFTLNTSPSSSRHRNTSGSSSGTPPPYLIPTAAQWPQGAATSSPIRRSGKVNTVFNFGPMFNVGPGNPLTTNKMFDLADVLKHDQYNNINTAFSLSNHRVQTLPELMFEEHAEDNLRRCGTDSYLQNYLTKASSNSPPPGNLAGYRLRRASTLSGPPDIFGTSPPGMEGPITFIAPELPEETLLEKEHNETLAKLNFILALADCVMELAAARGTPISAVTSISPSGQSQPPSMEQQLAEQVVLYFRALQLLSSALKLAKDELKAKRLQQTTSVKQVVRLLNHSYQSCLKECNDLKKHSLIKQAAQNPLLSATSADKLLYQHAIDMCQNAALDELLGNPHECCRRYQIAQILLHSLAQQVSQSSDQQLLLKYKEAVEKRLLVLQQQGFVYAYDTS